MNNPLAVMFLPVLYLLGSCFSLLQFQVVITLIAKGVAKAKTVAALEPAMPIMTAVNDYLIRVFGPAHKFVPQPTHVMLVAVLMAIVVHVGDAKRR
mmetsp:Transcript_2068/g.5448  ORF Transcript_2068/g.5448 Transcript_2068/m.5448 type:complete len:96 (-) Transcript_2068:326-613(-)